LSYSHLQLKQDSAPQRLEHGEAQALSVEEDVSHATKNRARLISRTRRIKGQIAAIERTLEGEGESEDILQLVTACRGALNGLMAELIKGHLNFHVLPPGSKPSPSQLEAAEELVVLLKRYFN
jgi:DNA-binding FrmR family transcriptional regulator